MGDGNLDLFFGPKVRNKQDRPTLHKQPDQRACTHTNQGVKIDLASFRKLR